MSAKERTITILGLVGTFFMPWPGEPEPGSRATLQAQLAHPECTGACAQALPRVVPVRVHVLEAAASGDAGYALGSR